MRTATFVAAVAAVLSLGNAAYADGLNDKSRKYAAPSSLEAPVVAPVNSWTGFYVGVGVGGDFVNHDLSLDASFRGRAGNLAELDGLGGNGVFGTAQVGYDWQAGRYVFGAFFDYDFGSSAESKISILGANAKFSLDDKWTVGGRVGYLVNQSTLIYGLAGYTEASFSLPRGLSKGDDFSGYTVGAGIETNLAKNWYIKGEYRYTELDKETLAGVDGKNFSLRLNDETTIQSARVVLSYKFNDSHASYESLK